MGCVVGFGFPVVIVGTVVTGVVTSIIFPVSEPEVTVIVRWMTTRETRIIVGVL